jgi:bacteriorhodopsin
MGTAAGFLFAVIVLVGLVCALWLWLTDRGRRSQTRAIFVVTYLTAVLVVNGVHWKLGS